MKRLKELRRFIDKEALGIEVAPYFNPIASKAEGYNVLILDVFDTERLRQNAIDDPLIDDIGLAKIEAVDLISDASQLAEVVESKGLSGKVHYVVSSHNFEHLPDPISFLKGCSEALVPGGVITLAVPDCRACFDHFRMPTRLSDWLAAYHDGRKQPTPEILFDFRSNLAPHLDENQKPTSFNIADDHPTNFTPVQNLKSSYEDYIKHREDPSEYMDAHCSTFFGSTFELMIHDLRHLGLIDLEVIEVSKTNAIEFYVHLRKPLNADAPVESDAVFYRRRHELMKEVNLQLGTLGLASNMKRFSFKYILRAVLGKTISSKLRQMNKTRRAKRRVGKNT